MAVKRNFNLIHDLQRAQHEVKREIIRLGAEIERHAVDYLDNYKPHQINNYSDLRKGIKFEVKDLVDGIKLRVFSAAKHSVFVHEGTKPHWTKVKYLHHWAKKKFNFLTETEVKGIAYAVQKKIAAKGTEAKPFMDVAFDKVQDSIAERIQQAFVRGFDK